MNTPDLHPADALKAFAERAGWPIAWYDSEASASAVCAKIASNIGLSIETDTQGEPVFTIEIWAPDGRAFPTTEATMALWLESVLLGLWKRVETACKAAPGREGQPRAGRDEP